jgi:hypothetical protein
MFLVIWVAIIFGTSCTVVRPNELFQLLNDYVLRDAQGLEKFKVLWGSIWMFVVKGWHFAEFAVLQILTTRAIDWFRASRTQTNVLIAALCCVAFAASDEWHQTFVPDRFGTLWDVFIDSLGVMTTAYVLACARRPTVQVSNADSDRAQPTIPDQPHRSEFSRERAFPFWTVGPVTGACVGLAIVAGSYAAWAVHGFPDFLFRSGPWPMMSAFVMAFGGALFGTVYAGVLTLATRLVDRTIRPRVQFRFAIILSIAVSYAVSVISLRRRELVGMEISLAIIVLTCFVVALATAVRSSAHGENDK